MNNEEKILELLEKLNGTVGTLTGTVETLTGTVEQHGVMLADISKRLDGVDGRLDSMDSRLDSMDGRLDSVETLAKRTAVLLENEYAEKLQALFDGHSLLDKKLDALAPRDRVERLEEDLGFMRTVVTALAKEVEELKKAQ